jgi:hypothetical protein
MKTISPVKQYHLIGRGFAGWHAKGIDPSGHSFSSSRGSLEDYTYWTGEECYGYLSEACEGCHVYDAQHLEGTSQDKDFASFIIRGPMVDPRLAGGEVSKFLHDSDEIKSLDFVSPAQYVQLLKERVSGVKIGTVCNGAINWQE